MADMFIPGIPDELYIHYQHLAVKHRRSLSAETLHLIEMAVAEDEQTDSRRAALSRFAARRRRLPPTPPGAPDSLTMLREDRDNPSE